MNSTRRRTRKSYTPSYRCQTRSIGQDLAFVVIDGRRHYLGPYDTPESRECYHRLIAEWEAAGGMAHPKQANSGNQFWKSRSVPGMVAAQLGVAGQPSVSARSGCAAHCLAGSWMANRGALEMVMKTQGEIEAAICEGISRFELEYMGRGPKDIHAHLIGDLLVVRLRGILTAAEQQLVKTLPSDQGRELLKQVRTQLMETARPALESMVQGITGTQVVSLHHDISTVTGEEVVLFTLATPPASREAKRG